MVPTMKGKAALNQPLDIPLSSLEDRPDLSRDISDLLSMDIPSGDIQAILPSSRICLKCGATVAEGHKFCGKCGTRFDSQFNLDSVSGDPPANTFQKRVVERVSFVNNYVIPANQDSAHFTLVHINDDGSLGDQIMLNAGENIIGRMSSPALNNDRFVSPKHLRIICHKDQAVIEDYGSLNGVFQRISNDSVELQDGDLFRIGEELLSYYHGPSKQQMLKSSEDGTELLGNEEPKCWGYLGVILGPFTEGNVYRLSEEKITLGRTHGDILFPRDGFVSGLHASLSFDGRKTWLTDMKSSNGTFLKLRSAMFIRDETYILIGNQLLRLRAV